MDKITPMKNKDNLVDQCCEYFGLSLPELAEKLCGAESTLKQWRKNLPWYGKVLLEGVIENHKLESKLAQKEKVLEQLQDTFKKLTKS